MATPLPQIDAHADALVTIEFDGLDVALPYRDGLADSFGDIGFAGGGAAALGMAQDVGGEFAQLILGEREGGHERAGKSQSYNLTRGYH